MDALVNVFYKFDGKAPPGSIELDGAFWHWTPPPVALPADPEEFWRADGGGSLRYALYSPPYGGAGPLSISLMEPEIFRRLFRDEPQERLRVWTIDPRACTWFINEWWDYLWVIENVGRGEVLVLLATATD